MAFPDAAREAGADDARMLDRFAVVFRIGEGALAAAGALEVDGERLYLRGGSGTSRQRPPRVR